MIKPLLVLAFLLSVAFASPRLTVKYGESEGNVDAGVTYFYDLGTTLATATAAGWTRVQRPADDYLLPALDLYCLSEDYTYCVFYDDTGYVSGVQIALPVEGSENSIPSDLTQLGFRQWTPSGSDAVYWVHKQFFVSNETLAKSAAERASLRKNTLFDGGVWVTDYNHELLFLNATDIDNDETIFTFQNCINGMSQHYFYNLTKSSDADRLFPWFVLIRGKQIVAVGFFVYGVPNPATSVTRNWFEQPPRALFKKIGHNAPEKMFEYADDPGILSLHTYFVDDPTTLQCDLATL